MWVFERSCNENKKTNKNSTNLLCVEWCCLFYVTISLLVLLDAATAMWSPHQHPAQQQQSHYHNINNYVDSHNNQESIQEQSTTNTHWQKDPPPVRGGSTTVQSMTTSRQRTDISRDVDDPILYQQNQQEKIVTEEQSQYQIPKIQLKHVSMALRLTSEWNRRLLDGVNKLRNWGKGRRLLSLKQKQNDQNNNNNNNMLQNQEQQQAIAGPYGDFPVNVHPSRSWQPPIPFSNNNLEEEEITVFHAKSPQQYSQSKQKDTDLKNPRGVCYWGPDLLEYLHKLVYILDVNDLQQGNNNVIIPLAMIYMDRACSVETPRSNNNIMTACPFCTPRTVHRLTLSALLLSIQAVYGEERLQQSLLKVSSSLNLPLIELEQMIHWMYNALGNIGLVVTMEQMTEWGQSWEAIFSRQ